MPSNKFNVRRIALLIALAGLCALIYVKFFGRVEPPPPTPQVAATIHPAFARLSALIDGHIDHIFSPLDDEVPPMPHQELHVLRETFADSEKTAFVVTRPAFATAIQLCDTLLQAIEERENASLSLADTRSKAYSGALAPNKKKEAEERRSSLSSLSYDGGPRIQKAVATK